MTPCELSVEVAGSRWPSIQVLTIRPRRPRHSSGRWVVVGITLWIVEALGNVSTVELELDWWQLGRKRLLWQIEGSNQ